MTRVTINMARGFTLLEVLIALAVLSISILGMAGMQMFSLYNNHNAYLHTQAMYFAYDVIDRMRNNRQAALLDGYTTNFADVPTGTTDCTTTTCTPAQLAELDLNQWKCSLGGFNTQAICNTTLQATPILPNGQGQIARNGNQFTITIQWSDRGWKDLALNAGQETFQITTQL